MGSTEYTVLGVVVIVILVLFLAAILYSKRIDNKKRLNKKLKSMLKNKGRLRSWKVISNVLLVYDGDKSVVCDNIVVAPYGVFVFSSIANEGDIYGEIYDDEWTCVEHTNSPSGKKYKIQNAVKHNNTVIEAFRHLLANEKIYNIIVEGFIVYSDKSNICVRDIKENTLKMSALSKILDKIKYEKDNKVDIEKISTLLEGFVFEK